VFGRLQTSSDAICEHVPCLATGNFAENGFSRHDRDGIISKVQTLQSK